MGDVSVQLSFDDFAEPAVLTDRYFFALYPPANVASEVAQMTLEQRNAKGLKGKPLQTERFHVTLLHLGDYAEERSDIVSIAVSAANGILSGDFDVGFDRMASFTGKGGKAPLVLQGGAGVQDVIAFQRTLADAIKRTSLHKWAKGSFTPHMTLMYDDRLVPEEAVEPVSWKVQEFALVRSLLNKTQHIVLGRWALGAAS
ncbi:MAG: 2'-5' RNA ligase family protein [Rhizobacter sp.]